MEYVQIVEFECSDIDAMREVARNRDYGDAPKPKSVTIVRDRDRPGTYATMLRFDSYEAAMQHSEAASTHELLEKLAPFMQGERRFYNLDVLEDESP
jgi:hypothetical protein